MYYLYIAINYYLYIKQQRHLSIQKWDLENIFNYIKNGKKRKRKKNEAYQKVCMAAKTVLTEKAIALDTNKWNRNKENKIGRASCRERV